MSIGNRIAELRKSQGVTQATLAKKTGLSASAIAMYETNRRLPDELALAKLCDALAVSREVLLSNVQPKVASPDAAAAPVETNQRVRRGDTVHAVTEHGATPTLVRESTAAATPTDRQLTQLALSREEARIILFLRMNPMCMPFIESYIRADAKQRDQLTKTWRLIHDFQGQSTL